MHNRAITCSMCGGKFFPASLPHHQKACARKRNVILVACDYCQTKCPKQEMSTHLRNCSAAPKDVTKQAVVDEFSITDLDGRVPCATCGRKFNVDRIDQHSSICMKITRNGQQRAVYDSYSHRQVEGSRPVLQAGLTPGEKRRRQRERDAFHKESISLIQAARAARQESYMQQCGSDNVYMQQRGSDNVHMQQRGSDNVHMQQRGSDKSVRTAKNVGSSKSDRLTTRNVSNIPLRTTRNVSNIPLRTTRNVSDKNTTTWLNGTRRPSSTVDIRHKAVSELMNNTVNRCGAESAATGITTSYKPMRFKVTRVSTTAPVKSSEVNLGQKPGGIVTRNVPKSSETSIQINQSDGDRSTTRHAGTANRRTDVRTSGMRTGGMHTSGDRFGPTFEVVGGGKPSGTSSAGGSGLLPTNDTSLENPMVSSSLLASYVDYTNSKIGTRK